MRSDEFTAEADGTVAIDVFGLGAIAYLLVTGRSPAEGRAQLMDRLATDGGLHPSAVSDTIPPEIDALVALATAPIVNERYGDVGELLEHLDDIDRRPEPTPNDLDPWDATENAELPDGSVVLRVLGTGGRRAFSTCAGTAWTRCSRSGATLPPRSGSTGTRDGRRP